MSTSPLARENRWLPAPAEGLSATGAERPVDLLLVNPPSPDADTWIRCQHRASQRAPDGTVWPQTALAQLAALFPDRRVAVIDANAHQTSWQAFAGQVRQAQPRWYVTQVGRPTLQNDLAGVALAKHAGAITVAFGPTATPIARELLQRSPALDFVLCGEPELTLRELFDTVEGCTAERPAAIACLYSPAGRPAETLGAIRGLAWRHEGEVIINPSRPLIARLDDLPLPAHALLPLGRYCAPSVRAPAAVVNTGRGCPGHCCHCLKHITYRQTVRLRSPERILEELLLLQRLGVRHVYMQADLFTLCRDQVAELCRLISQEALSVSWSCSSRVDAVDQELLQLMGEAGCRWITWAIESGSDAVLIRSGKGALAEQVARTLGWARAAGIRNWGSFLLGLPGETEETIRQTIAFASRLDLQHVTFDLAIPHPGTPFWEQATAQGWLRADRSWEEADASGPAILDYPGLRAARLEFWLAQAYREWALKQGALWDHLVGREAVLWRSTAGRAPGSYAEGGSCWRQGRSSLWSSVATC